MLKILSSIHANDVLICVCNELTATWLSTWFSSMAIPPLEEKSWLGGIVVLRWRGRTGCYHARAFEENGQLQGEDRTVRTRPAAEEHRSSGPGKWSWAEGRLVDQDCSSTDGGRP